MKKHERSGELALVKRVAHSIASANGHDDPKAYAEKVAAAHDAALPAADPDPAPQAKPAERSEDEIAAAAASRAEKAVKGATDGTA
jgi:hypothetical protein